MLRRYAGLFGDSFKQRTSRQQFRLGPHKQSASLDSRNQGSSPPSGYERSKRRWRPTIGYKPKRRWKPCWSPPRHGRRRTNDPECPIRRRHTTVELPWVLGLSRRFTVTDHTARVYAGRGLIRHRQGAHRSSIGGWSVFSARTPPQSPEKLNGSLWAWNARR